MSKERLLAETLIKELKKYGRDLSGNYIVSDRSARQACRDTVLRLGHTFANPGFSYSQRDVESIAKNSGFIVDGGRIYDPLRVYDITEQVRELVDYTVNTVLSRFYGGENGREQKDGDV